MSTFGMFGGGIPSSLRKLIGINSSASEIDDSVMFVNAVENYGIKTTNTAQENTDAYLLVKDTIKTLMFGKGVYLFDDYLDIEHDGMSIIGKGRDITEIKTTSTGKGILKFKTNTIDRFTIKDIFINVAGAYSGDAIVQESGLSQAILDGVRVFQANPNSHIYKNNGAIYIDNHWSNFDLIHVPNSAVSPIDFSDIGGGNINSNSWTKGRCTYSKVGSFFKISSYFTNYEYDNTFKEINFEICYGGGIEGYGLMGGSIENCYLYDTPNATRDFIILGKSIHGTPVKSRGVLLKNINRRSSTLDIGVNDIKLLAGEVESLLIEGGDNSTTTGYAIDIGNNLGITILGSRNWTITNQSLTTIVLESYSARKIGLGIGNSIKYGYDNSVLNRAKIFGSDGLILEGGLRTSNTNATITSGVGSPLGIISAVVGSIYMRTDGGAGTTLYVKESGTGNTGWVSK